MNIISKIIRNPTTLFIQISLSFRFCKSRLCSLNIRLDDFVVIEKLSFYDWLKCKDAFDLLHVDISNTGTTIETLAKNLGEFKGRVLFEGGAAGRDYADWMIKYNMKKFADIDIPFKVMAEDSYYDENDERTYYPCISELMR